VSVESQSLFFTHIFEKPKLNILHHVASPIDKIFEVENRTKH